MNQIKHYLATAVLAAFALTTGGAATAATDSAKAMKASADADYKAAQKKTGADYKAAKVHCRPMKGDAQKTCKAEAKATHEKAEADAKMMK